MILGVLCKHRVLEPRRDLLIGEKLKFDLVYPLYSAKFNLNKEITTHSKKLNYENEQDKNCSQRSSSLLTFFTNTSC